MEASGGFVPETAGWAGRIWGLTGSPSKLCCGSHSTPGGCDWGTDSGSRMNILIRPRSRPLPEMFRSSTSTAWMFTRFSIMRLAARSVILRASAISAALVMMMPSRCSARHHSHCQASFVFPDFSVSGQPCIVGFKQHLCSGVMRGSPSPVLGAYRLTVLSRGAPIDGKAPTGNPFQQLSAPIADRPADFQRGRRRAASGVSPERPLSHSAQPGRFLCRQQLRNDGFRRGAVTRHWAPPSCVWAARAPRRVFVAGVLGE